MLGHECALLILGSLDSWTPRGSLVGSSSMISSAMDWVHDAFCGMVSLPSHARNGQHEVRSAPGQLLEIRRTDYVMHARCRCMRCALGLRTLHETCQSESALATGVMEQLDTDRGDVLVLVCRRHSLEDGTPRGAWRSWRWTEPALSVVDRPEPALLAGRRVRLWTQGIVSCEAMAGPRGLDAGMHDASLVSSTVTLGGGSLAVGGPTAQGPGVCRPEALGCVPGAP